MNILPKKSWHVRTRDNIAKVKRDEARAAEEEKEREARIALAEQEARTEKLRIKARNKNLGSTGYGFDQEVIGPQPMPDVAPLESPASQPLPRTHINFFSEIESGSNTKTGNKDHEAEKKQEQEAYEKKIGLLVGLGQSAIETQTVKPWYQLNREEKDKDSSDTTNTDTNEMKRKASMDPMNDMLRYLGKKPKSVTDTKTDNQYHPSKEKAAQSKGGLPGTTSLMAMFSKYKNKSTEEENGKEDTSYRKNKEKKRKKHRKVKESRRDSRRHSHKKSSRKHRKHSRHRSDGTSSESEDERRETRLSRRRRKSHKRDRKHKRKSSRSDSNSDSDSQSSTSNGSQEINNQKSQVPSKPAPTIEQLRAERIRREVAERTKTERFLAGKPLVEQPVPEVVITDKLDGKYNSQFNPHLARKHQPKAPLF